MATSNNPQLRRLAAAGYDALDRYEKGEAGFPWTVAQLKAVVSAAELITDDQFGSSLRQAWGRLEITNAVMLSEKRRFPTDEQRRVIAEAISALRVLLDLGELDDPSAESD